MVPKVSVIVEVDCVIKKLTSESSPNQNLKVLCAVLLPLDKVLDSFLTSFSQLSNGFR